MRCKKRRTIEGRALILIQSDNRKLEIPYLKRLEAELEASGGSGIARRS
jgi:hypothetical protein